MLDLMLLFVIGGLIVTFVLNVTIRLKASRAPQAAESSPVMFVQTARSFGGGDFLASGLIAITSVFTPLMIWVASMPGTVRHGNTVTPINEGRAGVNWAFALPLVLIVFALNSWIVRSRHKGLLDWGWSAAVAALVLLGTIAAWYKVFG